MAGEYGTRRDGRVYPKEDREFLLRQMGKVLKPGPKFVVVVCSDNKVHRVSQDVADRLMRSGKYTLHSGEGLEAHLAQVSGKCELASLTFGHRE